jgi:hypothetical protein
MLAAEVAAAGAPYTGLEGEPVAGAIAEAEATQIATSPVSHAAATMPIVESRKFDARNPPRQARTTASLSGILPGYSCKEGRIVEDGLLVEFPCTPTRTRSVYSY